MAALREHNFNADSEVYLEPAPEIGLLEAIVRSALQDWFGFKCYLVLDSQDKSNEQWGVYDYFFKDSDSDRYGSFCFCTDYISHNGISGEGLRRHIRTFLLSGAMKLTINTGKRLGKYTGSKHTKKNKNSKYTTNKCKEVQNT